MSVTRVAPNDVAKLRIFYETIKQRPHYFVAGRGRRRCRAVLVPQGSDKRGDALSEGCRCIVWLVRQWWDKTSGAQLTNGWRQYRCWAMLSSFVLSPFAFCPSPFALRPSSFVLRLSPFALRLLPFAFRPSSFVLRPLGGIFFLLQTIAGSAAFYYLCSAKGPKRP